MCVANFATSAERSLRSLGHVDSYANILIKFCVRKTTSCRTHSARIRIQSRETHTHTRSRKSHPARSRHKNTRKHTHNAKLALALSRSDSLCVFYYKYTRHHTSVLRVFPKTARTPATLLHRPAARLSSDNMRARAAAEKQTNATTNRHNHVRVCDTISDLHDETRAAARSNSRVDRECATTRNSSSRRRPNC